MISAVAAANVQVTALAGAVQTLVSDVEAGNTAAEITDAASLVSVIEPLLQSLDALQAAMVAASASLSPQLPAFADALATVDGGPLSRNMPSLC